MSSADALLSLIEGYYGSYSDLPVLRAAVLEWIQEASIPQGSQRAYFKHLTRSISSEYRNRPDIVQLHDAHIAFLDIRRLQAPAVPLLDEGPVMSVEEGSKRMKELALKFKPKKVESKDHSEQREKLERQRRSLERPRRDDDEEDFI